MLHPDKRRDYRYAPVVTHCLYCHKEVIVPFCDATDFVCEKCKEALSVVPKITDETLKLLDESI